MVVSYRLVYLKKWRMYLHNLSHLLGVKDDSTHVPNVSKCYLSTIYYDSLSGADECFQ